MDSKLASPSEFAWNDLSKTTKLVAFIVLLLLCGSCWGQMNEGASLTYGTPLLVNEILSL